MPSGSSGWALSPTRESLPLALSVLAGDIKPFDGRHHSSTSVKYCAVQRVLSMPNHNFGWRKEKLEPPPARLPTPGPPITLFFPRHEGHTYVRNHPLSTPAADQTYDTYAIASGIMGAWALLDGKSQLVSFKRKRNEEVWVPTHIPQALRRILNNI